MCNGILHQGVVMKLNDIKINQRAIVVSVSTSAGSSKRLIEMGFAVGAEVRKVIEGISANLNAYEVKNTVVALRNDTAESVNVLIKSAGN